MKPVSGMAAGQIALTRIPKGAASIATARVSWMTPPLVAPYTEPPQPTRPATDAVLRMTPPAPCSLKRSTAYLQPRNTPPRLTATRRLKSSRVWSSKIMPSRGVGMPTLLNRMSSRPYWSTAAAIIACTCCSSETSVPIAMAVPPADSIWQTVSFAWSRSISAATTRAPSSANRSADTRPTPEPAPVTMALLPASTPGIRRSPGRGARPG